jgi:hypothetical protein
MSDKKHFVIDLIEDGYLDFNSLEDLKDYVNNIDCADGFPILTDEYFEIYKSCGRVQINVTDTKEECISRGEEWDHNSEWVYVGELETVIDKPVQLSINDLRVQFEQDTEIPKEIIWDGEDYMYYDDDLDLKAMLDEIRVRWFSWKQCCRIFNLIKDGK